MGLALLIAMGSISAALICYTYGVFSVRRARMLSRKHLIFFWVGLLFDTTGTLLMKQLASGANAIEVSHLQAAIHGGSGILAILLMAGNALLATILYRNATPEKMHGYRRFCLVVWIVWLVPFLTGMAMGMSR